MALIKGEHLILYIATLERSLGALLAQHNEDDKGQALADFFAAYPTPDNMELPEDLPDEELNGQYAVRNATLVPYHERTKYLMSEFQDIHVSHNLRSENDKANALTNLAISLTQPDERDIQVTIGEHHLLPPAIERIEEFVDSNVITTFECKE
ncbi:hypothetical protein L3X38_033326 [Prunus dulcis]|uniref:RNase H type-1 domain-containing protein n=1 Tax=Prunus dulcis TaxID=3755 RepID=A0AAD4VGV2_PRUDU|nr:hypothetical protein L3X38_033326 [Prunus dulcis]